jgi:opacity protein-like surface antigen
MTTVMRVFMKLAIVIGLTIGVPAVASAQAYVFGGGAVQQRQLAGESATTYTEFDPGFAINAGGGYAFGVIGVEGEYSYLRNNNKIVASTATGPADGLGNIGLRFFMANVRISPAGDRAIKPYLSGGVGGYKSYLHDVSNVIANAFGFRANGVSDGITPAFQFRAGIGFRVGSRAEAMVGYRYLRGGELLFLGTAFGDLRPDGAKTHHLEGGIKIGF